MIEFPIEISLPSSNYLETSFGAFPSTLMAALQGEDLGSICVIYFIWGLSS